MPPYRLGERIGGGANSEVFRAFDAAGTAVALKILIGEEAARPGILERLAAEVALSRRLSIPGLVRLFDSGRLDARPFLAMELIEGPTLKETMAKRRLPVEAAIAIVAAVADTLTALHRVHVVHRDVKPANVMLRGGNEPVLTDLSVAALTAEDRAPGGDLLGSPGYMAPELIEDRHWGPAADVFSLGVMLYMLLTDRRPFSGSPDEVMECIRHVEPLPPSSIDPGLPRELDAVVACVLAKNPAERWHANDLARALRHLQAQG